MPTLHVCRPPPHVQRLSALFLRSLASFNAALSRPSLDLFVYLRILVFLASVSVSTLTFRSGVSVPYVEYFILVRVPQLLFPPGPTHSPDLRTPSKPSPRKPTGGRMSRVRPPQQSFFIQNPGWPFCLVSFRPLLVFSTFVFTPQGMPEPPPHRSLMGLRFIPQFASPLLPTARRLGVP